MHSGFTLWFTGLSGAGKTTLARSIAQELRRRELPVELLDGDLVRQNLSEGLGFSKKDRDTNIKRIGFVANLLSRNGVCAIVAAISPYRAARSMVRAAHDNNRFVEVYVHCPLEILIQRDVKGLYRKAMSGTITNFTGISDPYEAPDNPDIVLHTDRETIEQSAGYVLDWLERNDYLHRDFGIEVYRPGFWEAHG